MSGRVDETDWEARYRAGTTGWERDGLNPAYLAWRAGAALLPCRILVPGAGRSPEPLAMAQAGFAVTIVDLAPSAIEAQRTQFAKAGLEASLLEQDLLAWQPDRLFDAIYDQTCLCALAPPLRPAYEAQLRGWLPAGGKFFVLFMQTGREGGPPFDCPLDEMRRLFAAADWEWPDRLEVPVRHPSGAAEQPAILIRR